MARIEIMVKIKICPRCRKPNLKNAVNVSGWLAPDMYECSCGYVGQFYVEIDPDDYELDPEDASED